MGYGPHGFGKLIGQSICIDERMVIKMKNRIAEELIDPAWYASAYTCDECRYRIKRNTPALRAAKQDTLDRLLQSFARKSFQTMYFRPAGRMAEVRPGQTLLTEDGWFSDLARDATALPLALMRLADMADRYRWNGDARWPEGLKGRLIRAAAHYGRLEADRPDRGPARFHESIFCMPVCAANIYCALLPDMEAAGASPDAQPETAEACRQLLRVLLQVWLLPERGNHTDRHPISPERFRGHVWWVGGNGLTYRPILISAMILQSAEMMDTLVYVARHILTPTCAAYAKESFWQEGICADGFGWGHGRQAYVRDYPTNGLLTGLKILAMVVGTPWQTELEGLDFHWLFNYMRGMTWAEYRRVLAPMQSRVIFLQDHRNQDKPVSIIDIQLQQMASYLTDYLSRWLTADQRQEAMKILAMGETPLSGYPSGFYEGTRYFWNNDDLIVKSPEFYFYVNMASSRCDGVESADSMNDTRNFFTADGSYVILRRGDEYKEAMGTWQTSRLPGVTERSLLNSEIFTETNWSGYNSRHNFAGGVARGENAVASFIFEKDGRRQADGAGVIRSKFTREILGVLAYKAYFVIGRTIVCLGAGITDRHPEYGHPIHTIVNNTAWRGTIELLDGAGRTERTLTGSESFTLGNAPICLRHDGILYGFYGGTSGQLRLEAEERKTDWYGLNRGNKNVPDVIVPIMEIFIDHGQAPNDAVYAYFMNSDEKERTESTRWIPRPLLNDTRIQAVESADGQILQGVFYGPGGTCRGSLYEIHMDHPAVWMLETGEDGYSLSICDPLQCPRSVTVTVRLGRTGSDEIAEIPVSLPTDFETGRPVTVTGRWHPVQ